MAARLTVALLAVTLAAVGSGRAEAQQTFQLEAGWNNTVYEGASSTVESAIAAVSSSVETIWHWDAAAQTWTRYVRDLPLLTTLTSLEQGEAYWIFASTSETWSPPTPLVTVLAEVVTAAGERLLLNVELADTGPRRTRGLMSREALDPDAGMLFLFTQTTQGGFWMKDTLIPLSIAFIDDAGAIVDILDMEPLTTTIHTPSAPYRWALEVNQGWFTENGVTIGDAVRLTGS